MAAIIPDDWPEGVAHREYWQQVSHYADMAIAEATTNREKLSELIDHLGHLPPRAQELILEYLASETLLALPESRQIARMEQTR